MNRLINTFFLFLIITTYSLKVSAQSDTTKVASATKKINSEINTGNSSNLLKAASANKRIKPATPFDLKIEKNIDSKKINETIQQNTAENHQNFLLENLPEDNDIIGKKYWKGKDVTHKRLESHLSLGTINSSSKTVKIECRDHSYVDGDRIRIYLNEKVVSTNIGLKGSYYVIYINLEKGYNRIDFQALNQGFSGPNTAEVNVYDDKGNLISAKEWNIGTGQIATLGIIKY